MHKSTGKAQRGRDPGFDSPRVNPALWLLAEHEVGIISSGFAGRWSAQPSLCSPLSAVPTGASESWSVLQREERRKNDPV